jgi:uncharacterized BrkB/YihY/UPF0761 family membrane protein
MNALEEQIGKFFLEKLPPMPANGKDMVAKILPWVFIVLGILSLLALLSVIGLFSTASFMVMGMGHAVATFAYGVAIITTILGAVVSIMAILSGYYMLNRKTKGWRIAFYSILLSFIVHLIHISILGIILDLIFAYLLFQVKEYCTES